MVIFVDEKDETTKYNSLAYFPRFLPPQSEQLRERPLSHTGTRHTPFADS